MDPQAKLTADMMSMAVAPVFLISAAGVLVSAMSSRYGRVIDRARTLLREGNRLYGRYAQTDHVRQELSSLLRRAKILRLTIILASSSIFFVVMAMLMLFLNSVFGLIVPMGAEVAFMISLIVLMGSTGLFIEDFAISLESLKHDIQTRGDATIVDQESSQ